MTLMETPDHHGSHCDLLWMHEGASPGKVDAIIVPTIRNPEHLDTASKLALTLGATLLTLHSGKRTSAASAAQRMPSGVNIIAVDVPDISELRLLEFETSALTAGTIFARQKDLSIKRNLGLLLAYMMGWQRIIFLDDDITVPCSADLQNAAGLLDTYNAVGMKIGGFQDNSVVCHAYRAIGGSQKSFIGGGALAIEIVRNRSFFPDIYNDDWFYILDPYKGLQPVAVTGTVIQSPYDPFREERAQSEEFGDVLAEGIFWLLDQGGTLDDANSDHWSDFLPKRHRFVSYILNNLDRAQVDSAVRVRMEASLRASLDRLALIEPTWCEKYLKAWMADRNAWEHHVRGLRCDLSADEAVRLLSKRGRQALSYVVRRGSDLSKMSK